MSFDRVLSVVSLSLMALSQSEKIVGLGRRLQGWYEAPTEYSKALQRDIERQEAFIQEECRRMENDLRHL